ncbi:hypothetical protein ABZ890_12115 [Streptomyces sp. NPDC046984]|uniref:hypothetical protein n=1 Tax=Streptomyces sp. NPDC046984 TaxID=3155138 RepID=UPI0033E511F9
MRPNVRRTDPRLQAITETIERLIPGAAPANMTVYVIEQLADDHQNEWSGPPDGLAEKIFTALYGRPETGVELSPLAQAEEAKRHRDLGTEVAVLNGAHAALTKADWYPARSGDLVHIHYEQAGDFAAFGETYLIDDVGGGLFSMQLLAHNSPLMPDELEGSIGCFAAEAADDPLYEAWFEAGPHRLTIIRDGRPVHMGSAR